MVGTPDDWMNADVDKMVMRTRERVSRLGRIRKNIEKCEKEGDLGRADDFRVLERNEVRMCRSIAVAVRARAKEVARYCEEYLHLTGVTEELIRENPWIICCCAGQQFDRICMLLDAKDAANGLPDIDDGIDESILGKE